MVETLLKWLEPPIKLLFWVAIIAGFLMMMHVTADVAGRTMFRHPLPGTTEIVSGWYMIAVAFLPWAYVSLSDSHIVVDLFTRSTPVRFRMALDVVVKIATAAWVLLFGYHTLISAIEQTKAGEVFQAAGFYVTVWPTRWLLPLAGFSMGVFLILRVISDVGHASRRGA